MRELAPWRSSVGLVAWTVIDVDIFSPDLL
jgi:hypothetical protein